MSADIVRKLAEISIFADLSDQEKKLIAQAGEIVTVKLGSYVVIESELSQGMYIVLSGRMAVYKKDQVTGNLFRLSFLEAGSYFGELSLFDESPRSASVCAEVESILFHLDGQKFNDFLAKSQPETRVRFYARCAKDLSARFRVLNGEYVLAQKQLWTHVLSPEKLQSRSQSK
jgi:CRP-like cAMP-binding protein